MFAKTRSQKLRDQAQELADTLAPHVENAKEQLAPLLAEARDKAGPHLDQAKDTLLNDVVPLISAAIADAKEQAAPHVEGAKDRFKNEVVPLAKTTSDWAKEQAGPHLEEAKRRGVAASAAIKGEDAKPKKGKKKLVVALALLAGSVVAAKKLLGDSSAEAWQPTHNPPPPAPTGGNHAANVVPDSPSVADNPQGGSVGEAASDDAESPHTVTTPDAPADVVTLAEVSDAAAATPDSAEPNADGSAPEGFTIKGNAGSMKYHTPTSPWYDRTIAEIWFRTPEAAQAAGFVDAEERG